MRTNIPLSHASGQRQRRGVTRFVSYVRVSTDR
jgi:hypothetical protein